MSRRHPTGGGSGLAVVATLAALAALSVAVLGRQFGRTGDRDVDWPYVNGTLDGAAVQPADPDRHVERQGAEGRMAFPRQDARAPRTIRSSSAAPRT